MWQKGFERFDVGWEYLLDQLTHQSTQLSINFFFYCQIVLYEIKIHPLWK